MTRRWSVAVLVLGVSLAMAAAVGPTASARPDGGRGVHPVAVPAAGRAVDTSHPDRTVGTGTPASCTSAAVVKAVKAGGVIRFSCGPDPVTIRMRATAKVVNSHGPRVVLDGGGTVTLDGGGRHRILYLNTCDPARSGRPPTVTTRRARSSSSSTSPSPTATRPVSGTTAVAAAPCSRAAAG